MDKRARDHTLGVMRLGIVPLVIAAAAAGCFMSSSGTSQQSSSSSSCPAPVPSSCPANVPSYATDVSPLLFQYCTSCHQAGGSQSGKPLDSWSSAASLQAKVETQVSKCSMPPSNSPQPSDADRQTILEWIACGSPDN